MDIITHINSNKELIVDWVYEFFEGKYTKEEVNHFLYIYNENSIRIGVEELAKEFNNLPNQKTKTIENWYVETDFYVFDLLPWNGSNMFRDKIKFIPEIIKKHNVKTLVDFGAGLGVSSIYFSQELGIDVTYVDLENSTTSRFAKFLMDKMEITNIKMMTTKEFFASDVWCDMILAMDCFEHIPNMEETFDLLTEHSYKIYHDSTFFRNENQPQHVYTPTIIDFINMCALRNYIPNGHQNLLNRAYLKFDNTGNLNIEMVP